jgi:formylglycine-generating enzyme required for sulfatase activity
MIKRLLLLLLPACASHLAAQTPCPPPDCACLVQAAESAAQDKDYVNAIRQYNAAAACDPARTLEFNARIEALFQQIDALRIDAERQREAARQTQAGVDAASRRAALNAADMQKQSTQAAKLRTIADSLAVVAKNKWDIAVEKQAAAEAEATRTQQALAALQVVFGDITDIYLQQATDSIDALRYHAAMNLAAEAAFLHVPDRLPAVGARCFELAYVFNETGEKNRLPALIDSLCAWNPALPPRPDAAGDGRTAVRAWLSEAYSAAYTALEQQYYPTMIPVPGGTFWMGTDEKDKDNLVKELVDQYKLDQKLAEEYIGSELPRHEVTLDPYQLAQTETTWYQYGVYCLAKNLPLPASPSWGIHGDHPVVNVSWEDAQGYLAWLNAQTGGGHRLPTEAEWEYAARGGQEGSMDNFRYAGGNELDELGWYDQNSESKTHPVGQKRPNQLDLYDMSGNVWEWCADWYGPYEPGPQKNPKGPAEGDRAVLRGGSWNNNVILCRSAIRNWFRPENRFFFYGFRSARAGR